METEETFIERALARVFRPFSRVEPKEAVSVAILALSVFLLLTAYYLLKTAREPLILLHGGAEVKSYASAGQSLLLVLVVRAYGSVAKRVSRMKLLTAIYCFFASNLFVFAALAKANANIGVVFYLWVGCFSVTAIAQFWSFSADVYDPEQGKRLFAVLGIGSSLGAVFGARIAKALVQLGPFGLMLGAALLLFVCLGLLFVVDRSFETVAPARSSAEEAHPVVEGNAFRTLSRDKYLLLIASLTLLVNWVNSNGEYVLDRTLLGTLGQTDPEHAAKLVGAFKAEFFSWVNLVGVLLQLFLVSRILTRFGVRLALLILPVVAFGGYTVMAVAPVLALIRIAKIAENSLDYSVQNTGRQALFLLTSRVEKYVGKTTVDTLFVRLGDVLSALTVWAGTQIGFGVKGFAALNLALILGWGAVVFAIGRENRRREEEGPEQVALEPIAG